ncbi:MAG: NAD(P)-dependent oxidoreductase [Armatimonadota bacterium]|nr:NAD(P)-dependent oxidoreductase [Armatimonadota bacterium]
MPELPGKKVLVIGAGKVGLPTMTSLIERGARVRALVRTPRALPAGVEPAIGDVLDRESLERPWRAWTSASS